MNRRILLATTALAAAGFLQAAGGFFGAPAYATTTEAVSCNGTLSHDQSAVATAVDEFSSTPSPYALQITGTCAGDYRFTTSPLTFINSGGTTIAGTDGFNGMVEISGAHITAIGMLFEGTTLNASNGSNASGSTFDEDGDLVLHDGAEALIENSQIGPGTQDGVLMTRNVSASVLSTTVSGNGSNGGSANLTSGIWVSDNSALRLGNPDDSDPDMVLANGLYSVGVASPTCSGFDILLSQSASAVMYATTIGGTTSTSGGNCGEVALQASASARMRDVIIGHYGGLRGAAVVYAIAGSSIWIDENTALGSPPGSVVTEAADTDSNSMGLVFGGGASSVALQNTMLTGPSSSGATVEASASSTLVLLGDTNISNSFSGGTAIEIDHSSSGLQLLGKQFGYSDATDNIFGLGAVQEQSSMDIGQGLYGSESSISWNTSGGSINVAQNSSFRLSGGVSISGGVTLQQGSNGFLNTNNGGSATNQSVSLGITCPFTTVPASHVSSPTKVSPPVSMASSFASATSPQCLPF
jgi:hypothetical protein